MASISLKYKSKSGNLTAPAEIDPGAMIPLATGIGTGSSGTITFSNIPNTYESLQIRFNALDVGSSEDVLYILANSDTGSNYVNHYLLGTGTAISGGLDATQTRALLSARNFGSSSTRPWVGIIDIHDYASTSKYKTIRTLSGNDRNGSGEVDLCSSLWMSTSAINSISFMLGGSGSWATTTTVSLYGIKRAGA